MAQLPRLVLPFWYRLTQVVPDKGPLNVCVCNGMNGAIAFASPLLQISSLKATLLQLNIDYAAFKMSRVIVRTQLVSTTRDVYYCSSK